MFGICRSFVVFLLLSQVAKGRSSHPKKIIEKRKTRVQRKENGASELVTARIAQNSSFFVMKTKWFNLKTVAGTKLANTSHAIQHFVGELFLITHKMKNQQHLISQFCQPLIFDPRAKQNNVENEPQLATGSRSSFHN